MLIALWLYSAIGCMSAGVCLGYHGRVAYTVKDKRDTAKAAAMLLAAWPVFSVLWAWSQFKGNRND